MSNKIFQATWFHLRRATDNFLLLGVKIRNSIVVLFDKRRCYYAEYFVDRQIRKTFFPDFSKRGFMLEIGCASPELLSMSQHFRKSGWRCVGVEPNPKFAKMHRDKGNEVLEYAAADYSADDQDFVVVEANTDEYSDTKLSAHSYSSLKIKPEIASHKNGSIRFFIQKHIKVKVRRLDEILQTHCPEVTQIDLVTVDVEGYEMEVMRGFTPSRFNWPVIMLENLFHAPQYEAYMKTINYRLHSKNHYNYIFVADQHPPRTNTEPTT